MYTPRARGSERFTIDFHELTTTMMLIMMSTIWLNRLMHSIQLKAIFASSLSLSNCSQTTLDMKGNPPNYSNSTTTSWKKATHACIVMQLAHAAGARRPIMLVRMRKRSYDTTLTSLIIQKNGELVDSVCGGGCKCTEAFSGPGRMPLQEPHPLPTPLHQTIQGGPSICGQSG